MIATEPAPSEPVDLGEIMRRRLDLLNQQFFRMSEGLAKVDDGLRNIILDHLDEIGLEDIRSQIIQS